VQQNGYRHFFIINEKGVCHLIPNEERGQGSCSWNPHWGVWILIISIIDGDLKSKKRWLSSIMIIVY